MKKNTSIRLIFSFCLLIGLSTSCKDESQTSLDQNNISSAGEASAGEAGAGEATAGEAGAGEATAGEAGAGEARAGEAGAGEARAGEAGAGEASAGEASAGEAGAGEASAGEASAGEAGAGEASAGEASAGEASAGEASAGDIMTISLELTIQQPQENAVVTSARERGFEATVNIDPIELAPYISWELTSSLNDRIPVVYDYNQALVQANLEGLENQAQTLTLTARIAPDFEQNFQITLSRDCQLNLDFSEDLDQNMWQVIGSATQDPRGWLEMTGFQQNVVGGLFLIGSPFNPGDLDVSFKIASGSCDTIGTCAGREISDGYAMSIWNISTDEIDDLWSLVGRSGNGAGIFYPRLLEAGLTERPEGFTIEFDTYPNSCPNNGFFDPVQGPHVEIYFDGMFYMYDDSLTREERCMNSTPGDAFQNYWSEAPALRDNQWHDVRVLIQANHIQVFLDEETVIDTMVPNFEFKGGVLAFSGGSGAVEAFQRFDDLVINSECMR